jgi:hypothetical protein
MNVGVDACLVGLERRPINEPGMVFGQKHGPLGHGHMTSSSSEHSSFIDITLMTRFSVGASASIHRIGEHVMEGRVSRSDPTDLTFHGARRGKERPSERNQNQTLRTDPSSVNFEKCSASVKVLVSVVLICSLTSWASSSRSGSGSRSMTHGPGAKRCKVKC